MKKWLLCCCLLLALPLAAQAEDEKIDPANYICAEFVAQGAVSQDPPVFQALQIDGYVSSNIGYTVADPQAINVLVPQAYLMCQEQPTAVVAEIWEPLKKKLPRPISGEWEADVTKCRAYNEHPENGSGFVIWLDAYNRQYNVTEKSILAKQETLDKFLAACAKKNGLDAIHDTVHEMARDEARHGKALEGMLKRYFNK